MPRPIFSNLFSLCPLLPRLSAVTHFFHQFFWELLPIDYELNNYLKRFDFHYPLTFTYLFSFIGFSFQFFDCSVALPISVPEFISCCHVVFVALLFIILVEDVRYLDENFNPAEGAIIVQKIRTRERPSKWFVSNLSVPSLFMTEAVYDVNVKRFRAGPKRSRLLLVNCHSSTQVDLTCMPCRPLINGAPLWGMFNLSTVVTVFWRRPMSSPKLPLTITHNCWQICLSLNRKLTPDDISVLRWLHDVLRIKSGKSSAC